MKYKVEFEGSFKFTREQEACSSADARDTVFEIMKEIEQKGIRLTLEHSWETLLDPPKCKLCNDTNATEGSKYCRPCIAEVYADIAKHTKKEAP